MLPISLLVAATVVTASPPPPCDYDMRAMLALGIDAFDQNLKSGWRELDVRAGCKAAAADLVRAYRHHQDKRRTLLIWHEGQLRAQLGQTEEAIALFEQTRRTPDEAGWNPYVDATIAFLRRDRAALSAARARLAATPIPVVDGQKIDIGDVRWPPNLDVVDRLIACFDQSYARAYSRSCGRPAAALPTGSPNP